MERPFCGILLPPQEDAPGKADKAGMKKDGRNRYAFKYEEDRAETKKEEDHSWKGQKEDALQAIHTSLPHTCRERRVTTMPDEPQAPLFCGGHREEVSLGVDR